MHKYNKIMLYFWLFVGIFLTIAITYLGITDGFSRWMTSYVFAILCFLMFFMRRWMMRRMERQLEYLAKRDEEEKASQK